VSVAVPPHSRQEPTTTGPSPTSVGGGHSSIGRGARLTPPPGAR